MSATIAANPDAQHSLAELAMTDTLTGLSNGRNFRHLLQAALSTCERNLAVLVLDLDRFKSVNDTLGHPLGDQLLCKASDRVRGALRPTDTLARLGGDEFAILLGPVEQPEDLDRIAFRIVELLDRPFLIEGHQVNVGCSIGIAVVDRDGLTYERLMKHADLALYAAKEAGRGTFRHFHQSLADQADARRAMELDLRKALALRQLEVHYRPRLDVETGDLVGLKTELYWRHPQRGLLASSIFLPLAAQIGLIPKIGKWLLQVACREAASCTGGISIAVGILEAQFSDRGLLLEAVRQALFTSHLDPGLLEIEVTESLLLTHDPSTLRVLHALRALGVRIVMNDFGIGYASLTRLTSFPFDSIKIAPSIASGEGTAANRAIVQAVATFGASLGVITLVDGIHSRDHLAKLQRDGGSALRGCRVEAALPSSELRTLLQSPRHNPTA